MIQAIDVQLIPAAGYIRMSTDAQEDSPARQRAEIEKLAEREGFYIVHWYEDHGLTGTESLNRPDFLKLLKDAQTGKFQAILICEQSRLSREDVFDAMMHWRILRDAGVRIVTCQRGELRFDELGNLITAFVGQYGARDEAVKIAERTVSGKLLKVRRGERVAGAVFGFDRLVSDESGTVVKRVHFSEKFQKPKSWRSIIVPSADQQSVDAVHYAFEGLKGGLSILSIVNEFKRRNLKTIRGNHWKYFSIDRLLRNPIYAGTLRAGYFSDGKVRDNWCRGGHRT